MHSTMCRAASVLVALVFCAPALSFQPTPTIRVKIFNSEVVQPSTPSVLTATPQPETPGVITVVPTVMADVPPASDPIQDDAQVATAVAKTSELPLIDSAVEPMPVDIPRPVWPIVAGATLRESVQTWADQAGWSLVWTLSEKEGFRLDTGNVFTGDFKDAVIELFDALPPHIQIFAELRPQNTPPLIYVTRQQGTY